MGLGKPEAPSSCPRSKLTDVFLGSLLGRRPAGRVMVLLPSHGAKDRAAPPCLLALQCFVDMNVKYINI